MALLILAFALRPGSQAAYALQTQITLIPGTATLDAAQEASLVDALNHAAPSLPSSMRYAAVSALNQSGGWFFVSVAGFERLNKEQPWLMAAG